MKNKIIISLIGTVVAIIIIVLVVNNKSNENEVSKDDVVSSRVEEMINNNAYLETQIGPEQFMYFVYNKKGEVLIESSGGTQFKKYNHDVVVIGQDEVAQVKGTDPLNEIKFANSLMGSEEKIEEDKSVNYVITVDSDTNIKKLYDNFGEGYGDEIVNLLKTASQEEQQTEEPTEQQQSEQDNTESSVVDEEELKKNGIETDLEQPLKIEFVITTNDGVQDVFSAYKKIYMENGDEYYDWAFTGYYMLGDWELPSEWYGDIENRPIEDMHSDAEKLLKSMDINMLSLMDNLKDIVEGLQTADLKMADYFEKSSEEQSTLIDNAIVDLDKCYFVVDESQLDNIKEQISNLSNDTDFNNVSLMLTTMYVCDKNGWLMSKQVSEEIPETPEIITQEPVSE